MDIQFKSVTKVTKIKLILSLEGGVQKELAVTDKLNPEILSTILSYSKDESNSFLIDGQEPLNIISEREGLSQTAELQEKAIDELRTANESLELELKKVRLELTDAQEANDQWAAKVRALSNPTPVMPPKAEEAEETPVATGQVMTNEQQRMANIPSTTQG